MTLILSSKKLTPIQKKIFSTNGLVLTEFNAIKIDFINFKAEKKIKNAIFTSQNAVIAFCGNNVSSSAVENAFCVGKKTKTLLETQNLKVVKMKEYASELAEYIVKNHPTEVFHFFRGNLSRNIIPSALKKNGIDLTEIEVYKTTLTPKKFENPFDGILFFSPSGVESFVKRQGHNNEEIPTFVGMTAFCIGKTTASEAGKYFGKVEISSETTVESVIKKAVDSFTR